MIKGKYFDGKSAKPYTVWLTIKNGNLTIVNEDKTKQRIWPLEQTHVRDKPIAPHPARLIHTESKDERLYINEADGWRTLEEQLPRECFQRVSLSLGGPSFAGYAAATIGLIIILFFAAPLALEKSAGLIPDNTQKSIGRHAIHSFAGGKQCSDPKGVEALDILMNRLKQGTTRDIEYETIVIEDDETVNALTGPGAVFGIFSASITKSKTPEQLAGVMAHEIAHAELYHPTRGFVRDSGIGLLFQMMFGTDTSIMEIARIGGAMKFSRDDEREADSYGQEILYKANIDPQSMTLFFEKLILAEEIEDEIAEDVGGSTFTDALSYISTHPQTKERIDTLKANTKKPKTITPILTKQQWEDLQNICDTTSKIKETPEKEE